MADEGGDNFVGWVDPLMQTLLGAVENLMSKTGELTNNLKGGLGALLGARTETMVAGSATGNPYGNAPTSETQASVHGEAPAQETGRGQQINIEAPKSAGEMLAQSAAGLSENIAKAALDAVKITSVSLGSAFESAQSMGNEALSTLAAATGGRGAAVAQTQQQDGGRSIVSDNVPRGFAQPNLNIGNIG